jgi:hypothetical protein
LQSRELQSRELQSRKLISKEKKHGTKQRTQ